MNGTRAFDLAGVIRPERAKDLQGDSPIGGRLLHMRPLVQEREIVAGAGQVYLQKIDAVYF